MFYWYDQLNEKQKTIVAALTLIAGCSLLAYFKDINWF